MIEPHDQLDKSLDDALRTYCEPPQNEGLEERILARVAESTRRTRPTKTFTVAMAAALVVAMAGLFWCVTAKFRTEPESTRTIALIKRELPQLRAKPVRESAAALASTVKEPSLQKKRAAPKKPRFPTPSSLSSEERALVQLVTSNAAYIPRELTRFASPIKPIEITAIEIKPLQLMWNTKEEHAAIDSNANLSGGNESAVLGAK